MTSGLRSALSRATKREDFSHHEATSPHVQPTPPTQTATSVQPTRTTQPHTDVISQLLPTIVAVKEIFQCLTGNQANLALVSTPAPPAVMPILDEPIQGTTLVNVNIMSVARRVANLFGSQLCFLQRHRWGHVKARKGKSFGNTRISRLEAALPR